MFNFIDPIDSMPYKALVLVVIVLVSTVIIPEAIFFFFMIVIGLVIWVTETRRGDPLRRIDKPRIDYYAYLKSDKWKRVRKRVLDRDNYTCRKCNKSGGVLSVHHIHYKRIGNERLEDLVTVCSKCHKLIHERSGKRAKYYPI